MKYSIQVENLVKKYKKSDKNAVDDISFDVEEGSFFTFLGPNGAGKTTTISMLTTTLSPTSGKIKIDSLDLEKEQSIIREKIGIIFQNPSIDLNLTAEENIRFHSILYGLYPFSPSYTMMPQKYKNQIDQLAEIIGIKSDLFMPLRTFSGGMKRKLEIIRSLMHSPKILFLDEPTVGLDPESRKNLWDYINSIRQTKNITIFLTTHYLDEADDADKVCIINQGKIAANGTPDELKARLAYEYISIKPMDEKSLELITNTLSNNKIEFTNGKNELKIRSNNYEDIRNVTRIIENGVKEFTVKRPSLEEAYISIIKDNFDL